MSSKKNLAFPFVIVGSARFWSIIAAVVAFDIGSKIWAVKNLIPRHIPHEIIGEFFRFTLSYNPGAAFGMSVGSSSRWFFGILAFVVMFFLVRSTRDLVKQSRLASYGVPIVIGGALGNVIDRIRYRDGVVDFIDIGIGSVRFWTFNIADIGVSVGAVFIGIAFVRAEREREKLISQDRARIAAARAQR